MTVDPAGPVGAVNERPDTSGGIDSDVHVHWREGLKDLAPYLDLSWRQRLRLGELPAWAGELPGYRVSMPLHPYVNPSGTMRLDAVPPGGGLPASDPEFAIKDHLDRCDLRAAVIIGGQMLGLTGLPDVDLAAAIASAYNRWLADVWLAADPRFKGSIHVDPQDPQQAAAEVERWGGHPDMVQVFVPDMGVSLGKRHFYPIYEAATHYGLPVAIHIGAGGAGKNETMMPVDAPSYYFEVYACAETIYQRHAVSLVAEGVFERFPTLKVALVEGGFTWLPSVMWKMDKAWKGVRSEVPWLTRLPSEYLIDHIRVTTQPMPEPPRRAYLTQMLEMMHADRMLMFATDYPHWDADDPGFALRGLAPDLRQKVLVDNALDYYRLAG